MAETKQGLIILAQKIISNDKSNQTGEMVYRVQWYDSIIPESNLRKMFPDLLKEYESKQKVKPNQKEGGGTKSNHKESQKHTTSIPSSPKKILHKTYSQELSAKEVLAKKLIQKQKNASGTDAFHCDFCEKKFKTSIDLKCHIYIHQFANDRIKVTKPGVREGPSIAPVKSNKSKRKPTRKYTPLEKTKCDICGKEVTSKRLESHKITYHLKNGKFPCSECEKRFQCNRDLQRHAEIHKDGKLEKTSCDICGKILTKRHLENHKNRFHSQGEYTCKKCNKIFKHLLDLDWHLKKPCTQTPNAEETSTRK
ncbi:oocyte zinc finger protein XlCOF26-like [Clytia hemisphaerica]|uniref:C2H2-type domain-containing protein n=1 Tax=Clytia hemisphaerica TaxID=252671 RepID=A0A7M5V914_9CNID